ncbi:MAG: zinc-ribbon domain-containing protein [Spirochaetes bacterium]|nr:zinc-ribbon domain-containing protein [Spirochaetota bacterium]
MIVRCTHCDAAYAVDDGKITNKKFGFSCPKCGTNVIIDNRRERQAVTAATAERGRPDDLDMDLGLNVEGEGPASDEPLPTDEELARALEEFDSVPSGDGPVMKDDLSTDDFGLDAIDSLMAEEPKGGGSAGDHEQLEDEALKLEDFGESLGAEIEEVPGEFDDISFIDDTDVKQKSSPAKRGAPVPDDGVDFDSIMLEDEPPPVRAGSRKGEAGGPVRNAMDFSDDIIIDSEIKSDEVFSRDSTDIDESTTIDLDSLDIELDEGAQKKGAMPDNALPGDDFIFDDLEESAPSGRRSSAPRPADDEFDTTIDLETLDITLDEVEELKRGVDIDDDERLTLEDTGLSIDELGVEEAPAAAGARSIDDALAGEEDIKLNLREIDPSLSVDDLAGESDLRIIDEVQEDSLPEIDLEKLQKEEFAEDLFERDNGRRPALKRSSSSEDYLDIETRREFSRYQSDLEKGGPAGADTVPGGVINFSIDYSLTYSRLGAVLRLSGLYLLGLLPRLFVNMLYSAVSAILGLINTLLVLFRGYPDEDFLEVQENTLRGAISLAGCAFDVVEDMPGFTGRRNIDFALQLSVTYPVRYSRFLAFLRLTGIGIVLALLPHLVLVALLSLGALLIYFVGLVAILVTRRWPNVLFDFMVRYFNYMTNVSAFMTGLVDRYPSFRFE